MYRVIITKKIGHYSCMNVCMYVEIYLFYQTIYLRLYTLKSPEE